MAFLQQFIQTYIYYINELWWSVLLGFLLSGFFFEFIPTDFVKKHLGQKGLKPILVSTIVGIILPICCFGTLPLAVTFRNKGARLGPILAFLVATPATSASALIVCWKLLGGLFTVYIFVVVIIMGLMIGLVGNRLKHPVGVHTEGHEDCCHEKKESQSVPKGIKDKIIGSFRYAFVTLPKEIGLELLLGVAIASFVLIFAPIQAFIKRYLSGALGYLVIIVVGLATYVCSTASVPMADAFMRSGLTSGQALTYLLVGPITSYGTLLVIKKEFGLKILSIYLCLISLLSLLFGISFDLLLS